MHIDWIPLTSRCLQSVVYICNTDSLLVSCSIDSSTKILKVHVHHGADSIKVLATIEAQYSNFVQSKISIQFEI